MTLHRAAYTMQPYPNRKQMARRCANTPDRDASLGLAGRRSDIIADSGPLALVGSGLFYWAKLSAAECEAPDDRKELVA